MYSGKPISKDKYAARHKAERPASDYAKVPRELEQYIVDPTTKKRYLRGRFLGKGGFAKCYELTDMETKEVLAGKIISKTMLTKPHQKEKMSMEIAIHRSVGQKKDFLSETHKHIVGFHGFFEDADYIYILLELCRRRSMMELHKRRKALTEPEVRYFMKQIVEGCKYLHDNKIIHRDLKLGNLFLNDDMEVKIGDFGLATRVENEGERKKTLCGTPNYIAPEVLNKKGHSFEVDVWSLGCILFTLLVGKPPFETQSLQDTYKRIKRNEYYIPSKVSHSAQLLIIKLLRPDPSTRPNLKQVLEDDFFEGFTPNHLPISSLTMAPRFATTSSANLLGLPRKPLNELNSQEQQTTSVRKDKTEFLEKMSKRRSLGVRVCGGESKLIQPGEAVAEELKDENQEEVPLDCYLSQLHSQLTSCLDSKPVRINVNEDDAEDPASVPVYWVGKWVDYSDKYGLGYQLSDNSVGVLFNDQTRLILYQDGENLQYIEADGAEHFHTLKGYPGNLEKKVTLLKYFLSYMNDHLLKAGAGTKAAREDESGRLPFLKQWFRTQDGIVLHLTNGTLQINFFKCHTKIIVCPLMAAVTYIDETKRFRTFPLKNIEKYGCSKSLAKRLGYALKMVGCMQNGTHKKLLVRAQTENDKKTSKKD
ncbi:Serine/threonine-protein kinase PLK1 [Acropora cervicornis]|uniref:Serine/threonine-protein kinase PLK n=1 Tax=Acropora cervicornis TaxID=6130 RepID=A0AAD9VBF0_ACRCE|nr:Serine/threonine-protein kinase PLK1 [Acropora cervicornis]